MRQALAANDWIAPTWIEIGSSGVCGMPSDHTTPEYQHMLWKKGETVFGCEVSHGS